MCMFYFYFRTTVWSEANIWRTLWLTNRNLPVERLTPISRNREPGTSNNICILQYIQFIIQNMHRLWYLKTWKSVGWLVGWLYWGFTSLQRYFIHIATWKQEITNLCNLSSEAGNRTPDLLLRKSRAEPLGHRRFLEIRVPSNSKRTIIKAPP